MYKFLALAAVVLTAAVAAPTPAAAQNSCVDIRRAENGIVVRNACARRIGVYVSGDGACRNGCRLSIAAFGESVVTGVTGRVRFASCSGGLAPRVRGGRFRCN